MAHNRLTFEGKNFGPHVLRVAHLKGEEHLSRLYRFDITLGSRDNDLKFGEIVNNPAMLTLAVGQESARVQGVVMSFEQRGFSSDVALYHAVLMPRLALLTLNFRTRIFQQMNVRSVIEEVLKAGGFPEPAKVVRFALNASYPTREYCAQYQESDWDFICRLMEREGIFFFFEEGDGGEVMVISDRSRDCPPAELSAAVVFHPDTASLAEAEARPTVHSLSFSQKVGTGTASVNDYNYRTPDIGMFASVVPAEDANGVGVAYEFGAHHKDPEEGQRLAQVRMEEQACARTLVTGGSNVPVLRPGATFKLELGRGFRSDLDGEHLVTHVTHVGSQESGLATAMGLEGATYHNDFSALPTRLPYRPPRRTPVPRVPGLMTGVTESPGGPHPHIDEQGRYRMRMHFDLRTEEQAPKAEATHPIRMNQPFSGPDFGWHSPNHEESEMVVAFVNGDPDRPMALGTVPNPTQKSPATAPNKHQSVFRSKGRNELTFDDTVGGENIFMHATKNRTSVVEDSEAISVGGDRGKSVGNNESNSIGVNRKTSVGTDDTLTVGGKQEVTVSGGVASLTVGAGDRVVSVTGDYQATASVGIMLDGRSQGTQISGTGGPGVAIFGRGGAGVAINGNPNVAAKATTLASVEAPTIGLTGGDLVMLVAPKVGISAGTVQIVGTDEIMLTSGGSSITIKPGGITISSSGPITVTGSEVKLNT